MRLTKQKKMILMSAAFFVLVCLLTYLLWGKTLLELVSDPTVFREWLNKFGLFDEVIFILIRAAQTVVKFIPAEPLEIAAGYAWGATLGMLYCVVGNVLGTLVIFVLTKYFGQKLFSAFMPEKDWKFIRLLKNKENLYMLLFFIYLIPGLPKDVFTYFVGILPVKIVPFLLLTSFARMPSVLSSTLCGEKMAEQQYHLSAVILIITLVLATLGGILYRKFVNNKEIALPKENTK